LPAKQKADTGSLSAFQRGARHTSAREPDRAVRCSDPVFWTQGRLPEPIDPYMLPRGASNARVTFPAAGPVLLSTPPGFVHPDCPVQCVVERHSRRRCKARLRF